MGRWLIALLVWGVAAAGAQAQQQRDPFNGQFGALELALPPGEAARQARLMGDALAALAPQRPGQLDVYMITAALWGDPVFEREATQAEAILRPHLGAEGRSIVLSAGGGIGNPRNLPAATPNNLAAAIGHVGSLIDPAEDLVVVFITTHGSPDGTASLREHNRLVAGLRPTHLSSMLNTSNIRNRVVIVSACFSGAFIAPLANDDTIVLTAAAPDRSSFGCQPQNEWTFFGDALFNNALRRGDTLIEGFDNAKRLIERWEREQSLSPPSNPQRFVGARAADIVRRAERAAAER
ncbi:MAG: C13 family peptidase [Hyphomonadaceae bacterium]|nr:C13 family peptidase [Hyphomonadaceae bacterium]